MVLYIVWIVKAASSSRHANLFERTIEFCISDACVLIESERSWAVTVRACVYISVPRRSGESWGRAVYGSFLEVSIAVTKFILSRPKETQSYLS